MQAGYGKVNCKEAEENFLRRWTCSTSRVGWWLRRRMHLLKTDTLTRVHVRKPGACAAALHFDKRFALRRQVPLSESQRCALQTSAFHRL